MIPKITNPLAKGIRTTEGVLIFLTNLVIGVAAWLDPNKLPPKTAAIVVGATSIALAAQRGLIKAVAVQKEIGVGDPAAFGAPEIRKLLEEHGAVHQAQVGEITQVLQSGLKLLSDNVQQHLLALEQVIADAGNKPLPAEETPVEGTFVPSATS